MPPRFSLGPSEKVILLEMLDYYRQRGLDPGYDGIYEERYCSAIVEYMGGGYADAVCSGTAAVYIALKALDLKGNSEVIVSPITETGSVSPIILAGLKPKFADTKPKHYNVGAEKVIERFTDKTSAVVLVHCAGQPITDIKEIVEEAHNRNIRIVEDCSQTIGGQVGNTKVGLFGDIAAWSTGSRKNQTSGANGGIVYSPDKDLMRKAVSYADRGKPKLDPGFDETDPNTYLLPALNLNGDEISCAMGIASLARLEQTRANRIHFVKALDERINARSSCCKSYGWTIGDSPFFQPIIVDTAKISVDKESFARAVRAEGIPLNPHYSFLCADWSWLKSYTADDFDPPNARWIRDNSFNVYLNENYGDKEADDVIESILKVEQHYSNI